MLLFAQEPHLHMKQAFSVEMVVLFRARRIKDEVEDLGQELLVAVQLTVLLGVSEQALILWEEHELVSLAEGPRCAGLRRVLIVFADVD